MIKFGSEITQFIVEYAENIIFKLKERKEKDERTIISIIGEINLKEDIIKIKK